MAQIMFAHVNKRMHIPKKYINKFKFEVKIKT
jgi:hypothetical protein